MLINVQENHQFFIMSGTVDSGIILVYFIGTVGMLILAGAIFFFFIAYQKRLLQKQLEINEVKAAQQKEILQNTISSQEKERKRIAQDLHDEVGAMLSVVKLNIGRIEKKSVSESEPKQLAAETKLYIDDLITQVRRISRALLPPSLEKLGIYFALVEFANWVNKSELLKIECRKGGEQFRFDEKQELALFRILQELLNNAIKHSGADRISVNVKFSENSLFIVLNDNGKGFDIEEKMNSGLGLKNLESRTQILGAKFKMKSNQGKGTTAIIVFNSVK